AGDRLAPQHDGAFELRRRLADAREHDLRRIEARRPRDLDFPDRVRVHRDAEAAQEARDGQRRVRFQGVVQLVGILAERRVDRAVPLAKHRRAVHVDGRPLGVRDGRQRHTVAEEGIVLPEVLPAVLPAVLPDGLPRESGGAGRLGQRDTLFYSTLMSSDSPAASPLPASPGDAIEMLIQRCLRGDQLAWEQIVGQHWRKVFNVAYKFVGKHDEAEDLTQDIFLKIFRSLDTFDRRAIFQTWLISISRNLCIDHDRSVRKERETIDRDVDANELTPASNEPGPVAALEQRDRVTLLRQAMAELPDTLRTAVLMRDIQE